MNKHLANLFVPTLILLWAFAYWIDILGVSARNKLLVTPVCILIVLFYCYFTFVELRSYRKERAGAPKKEGGAGCGSETAFLLTLPKKEIAILFIVAVYLLVVPYLGFGATSFLFMFAMLYLLGVRKWGLMTAFSVISTAVLFVAFKIVLMVPLPGGILGF